MALLLSSQGLEKKEFRRLFVLFLTAIDFLIIGYYILVGLIEAEMLIDSLRFLPAMLLGFFAGILAFWQGERGPLQTPDPGHHPGSRSLSPLSTWG